MFLILAKVLRLCLLATDCNAAAGAGAVSVRALGSAIFPLCSRDNACSPGSAWPSLQQGTSMWLPCCMQSASAGNMACNSLGLSTGEGSKAGIQPLAMSYHRRAAAGHRCGCTQRRGRGDRARRGRGRRPGAGRALAAAARRRRGAPGRPPRFAAGQGACGRARGVCAGARTGRGAAAAARACAPCKQLRCDVLRRLLVFMRGLGCYPCTRPSCAASVPSHLPRHASHTGGCTGACMMPGMTAKQG